MILNMTRNSQFMIFVKDYHNKDIRKMSKYIVDLAKQLEYENKWN